MKRVLLVLLAVAMVLSCLGSIVHADQSEGAEFARETMYKAQVETLPLTFAATVRFDETIGSSRGGVILGNYVDGDAPCFNFEIHQNGNPRLYIIAENGMVHDYIFKEVSVYTGQKTQVMISVDTVEDKAVCYLDGEAVQTLSIGNVMPMTFQRDAAVGGDLRSGNGQYFKGELFDVAWCEDTGAQVTGQRYILTGRPEEATREDGSGPVLKLEEKRIWLKDYKSTQEYAYSFAVLGDIQSLTCFYPDKLHYIYDWLAENVEEKKIKHVFGLGDITDDDTEAEWQLFLGELEKLEGLVPYSLVRGNHDSVMNYKKFITWESFGHTVAGSFDQETMLNTYQLLDVGQVKYLILNLDIGPSDRVLQWAEELIKLHSDRNVIITTHIYLYSDGTTLDSTDPMPALKYGGLNTGDTMWEKLFKKHENIVLILSGHIPVEQMVVTQTEGDHGNTVTQMLIDPQATDITYEGAGLITMLYFSEDGRQVDVEYYAAVKDAHYIPENQFHMELDLVDATQEAPIQTEKPADIRWYLIVIPVILAVLIAIAVILLRKKA